MFPGCKHVARKIAACAKNVKQYGLGPACVPRGSEKTQHVSEQVFPLRKYFQAHKRRGNLTQSRQVSSAPCLRKSPHGMVLFEF
jgi:hypothetical protein